VILPMLGVLTMPATEKISVTIGREELRRAKQLASRFGLSLSTFINDAVREQIRARERREAGRAVIATFAPDEHPTTEEMRALLSRWGMRPSANRARRPRKPRARTPLSVKRRSA